MKLNQLPKTTAKSKKRVGRGYGSGKGGHTVGRGQKGQKSRSKIGLLFEGTKMRKSLIRRLPMRRGKLKFKTLKTKPVILNIKYLNMLPDGIEVNLETLVKNGLVTKEALQIGVKILGDGALEKKLIVSLPVSKGARKKIEKAGGKVIDAKKAQKKKTLKKKTSVSSVKSQKISVVKKTSKKRKTKNKTAKKSKAKK
jgi:large subunit ribosomal protein L15